MLLRSGAELESRRESEQASNFAIPHVLVSIFRSYKRSLPEFSEHGPLRSKTNILDFSIENVAKRFACFIQAKPEITPICINETSNHHQCARIDTTHTL